jgi:hypothetical protein
MAMPETLSDQIIQKLDHLNDLYHRLLLVVAPAGGGKTVAVQEVAKRINVPLINFNLALSKKMLELTERQRALKLPRLIDEIVKAADNDTVILDNIEILFDANLKQDPLRLLQGISRNRKVVSSWNGIIDHDRLTYAAPGHPEYRKYNIKDVMVAFPDSN